ncbi:hypothetical protein PHYBLDRAFT_173871 [Phycomyces blakesleeanus NRRL 1555(-)]|uniref:Uncharacterized protein n=1 Tax=Phycomyces blakesleeanus (strain ATCC 8743b / DSM 1359 / FGSC 10004 / NBRC 33097 / NRRL 1555) TaxID=763407 RepID=A0A162N2Y1_PHYB8|nr:hypothetical protein PHYBLDRAFT_173871 [Phycomyces blakesleeanus NRRL 1555(-)]OAD67958.1 hypothetical protein PHYBLDRAFT_173871 [Phycomyces blakesleeanus NRRL 1555(-)]|eukprot:XP_018285998.1 hypothetical protein PHYBLDRAFT_173871 [Phycomyces blakesleeanus NRRL 1555(-)]
MAHSNVQPVYAAPPVMVEQVQQQPPVAYCAQPTPVYYSPNRMSVVNTPNVVPVAQYGPYPRSFCEPPDCCCFRGQLCKKKTISRTTLPNPNTVRLKTIRVYRILVFLNSVITKLFFLLSLNSLRFGPITTPFSLIFHYVQKTILDHFSFASSPEFMTLTPNTYRWIWS